MAIHDGLGVSVRVKINETAALEYADPDPSPDAKYPITPMVSKYIESRLGNEYLLECMTLPQHHWTSANSANRLSFQVYIDDAWRAGWGYSAGAHGSRRCLRIEGARERPEGASHETLYRFRFDAVATVDGDDVEMLNRDMQRAAGLGTIRVEVWRCEQGGSKLEPDHSRLEKNDMSVAEKALKGRAISHGTSFSDPNIVPMAPRSVPKYLDKEPYVIFEFKYRSRDGLRSELILPRTPSAEPAAEGVDALSPEDLRRLAGERLAQIKEEKKPVIKPEFNAIYDLTGEGVDGSSRPVEALRRRKTPETIDLCGDD